MKKDLYTFFLGSVVLGLAVLFLTESAFADESRNTTDQEPLYSNNTTTASVTTISPPSNSTIAPNTTHVPSTTPAAVTTPNASSTLPPNATTVLPSTSQGSSTSSSGTTAHISTTSSTAATPTTPPQHFDAASFIGGIILCAGVIAIVFFGCKFYKARTSPTFARY